MKKVLILILILIFFFISCGKKGDPYPKRPSLTNKLCSFESLFVFKKNG